VRDFSFKGSGGSYSKLFDGTEKVLSWDNILGSPAPFFCNKKWTALLRYCSGVDPQRIPEALSTAQVVHSTFNPPVKDSAHKARIKIL
jgi:hypothetical protein